MRRVFSSWLLRLVPLACLLVWATLPLGSQRGSPRGEWRTYGGDLANTRYSPLDQITAANFKNLEIAWRFKTDNLGPRPEFKISEFYALAEVHGVPPRLFSHERPTLEALFLHLTGRKLRE